MPIRRPATQSKRLSDTGESSGVSASDHFRLCMISFATSWLHECVFPTAPLPETGRLPCQGRMAKARIVLHVALQAWALWTPILTPSDCHRTPPRPTSANGLLDLNWPSLLLFCWERTEARDEPELLSCFCLEFLSGTRSKETSQTPGWERTGDVWPQPSRSNKHTSEL